MAGPLSIKRCTVGGNIEIRNAQVFGRPRFEIGGMANGNLVVTGNHLDRGTLLVSGATAKGDIILKKNHAGSQRIERSRANGHIKCFHNSPSITDGGGNFARRGEGQCARHVR
jgi:hypothetical protein